MPLTLKAEHPPLREDESGVLRVGSSRVTLDQLIQEFHQGLTAEEIVECFPSLELAEVYGAVSFYLSHRPEVDAYLAARAETARLARQTAESSQPRLSGLRERLLSRKRA